MEILVNYFTDRIWAKLHHKICSWKSAILTYHLHCPILPCQLSKHCQAIWPTKMSCHCYKIYPEHKLQLILRFTLCYFRSFQWLTGLFWENLDCFALFTCPCDCQIANGRQISSKSRGDEISLSVLWSEPPFPFPVIFFSG